MPTPLRVLILEDSPTDAGVMVRHLREAGYALDWRRVETETAFLAHLDPTLDLLLIDHTLPDFSGRRALEILRERGWGIAAIIVTGTIGEETALELLRLGAADYLLKDRLARLGTAVRNALARRALRGEQAAEGSAQASEARARFLAQVLEQGAQPFGVSYPDGRIGICNAALCALLGYSEAELRALDWSRDLTPPEWQALEAERLAQLHPIGQPVRYEKELLRKDGSRVPVELLVHLMRDAADSPPYYYAFVADLTARKRMEGRLARLNECFLSFGIDSQTNINRLVAMCGEELGAACALYNRLDDGKLCAWGQWNVPADFNPVDEPSGHICYDLIRGGRNEACVIRHLPESAYARTDPNVLRYGLQTYVGKPVSFGEASVGSLCMLYREDRVPSEEELKLLGVVASAIGVEERRKQAEDALREGEERYRSLIENSFDAILLTAPDGRILAANPEACRIFGRSEEEICRAGRAGLVDAADPRLPVLLEERARTGKARGELIFVRKDGTRFPGETSSAVFRDRDGLLKTSMTIRDITERKRVEEMLVRERDYSRTLVHGANAIVLGLDLEGRVTVWNRMAERVSGYSWADLQGKDWFEVLVPRSRYPQVREEFRRLTKGGLPEEFENPILTRSGEERIIAWRNSLVREGDRVAGTISFGIDVTEPRRTRQALIERTRQLEAIRAVTIEITRELDLTSLLALIVKRATELLGVSAGSVRLWNEEAGILIPRAWQGYGDWIGKVALELGEGVVGRVAEHRKGMIVNGYRSYPHALPILLQRTQVTGILAEPLVYRDRLLGVIAVDNVGTRCPFTEHDQKLLVLFASQAAIAIENARLHESTLLRAQQLATLNDLTRTLTMMLDPPAVAREILAAVQVLTPGIVGQLWEIADAGESLRLLATVGTQSPEAPPCSRLAAGEGLAGLAGSTRRYVTSPDVTRDPRFVNKAWAAAEGLASCICLPLIHQERLHGSLVILTRAPHAFLRPEVDLLQAFAAQAAIALENANLFHAVSEGRAEVRALTARLAEAEEAERERLARELHDQVGQNLTALGINLNILRSQVGATASPEAQSRLDDSFRLVDHTTERIRDVMGELRPPVLDDYGLVAALRWYAEGFSSRTHIVAEVQGEEPAPRLSPPVEIALFRIAQEALTNVAKHAAVTRVRVGVETADAAVRMVIADDGVGFDPSRLGGRSRWGLLSMSERAGAVGGRCTIDSQPGEGTWVVVEVPR